MRRLIAEAQRMRAAEKTSGGAAPVLMFPDSNGAATAAPSIPRLPDGGGAA